MELHVTEDQLPKAIPIRQHLRKSPKEDVLNAIAGIITMGVGQFSTNSTMSPQQIATFAKDFISLHDMESFEDLIYTFQLMRNGYFGEIFIVDQSKIMTCFGKVREIKAVEREEAYIRESKKHEADLNKLSREQVVEDYQQIIITNKRIKEHKESEEYQKEQAEIKENERLKKYYEHLYFYASSLSEDNLIEAKRKLDALAKKGKDVSDHLSIVNKYLNNV